jgi:hypothetical protein
LNLREIESGILPELKNWHPMPSEQRKQLVPENKKIVEEKTQDQAVMPRDYSSKHGLSLSGNQDQ